MTFAIFVPVGPTRDDVERLGSLLSRISELEPGLELLLIDDSPEKRDLLSGTGKYAFAQVDVLDQMPPPRGRLGYKPLATSTFRAVEWLVTKSRANAMVKLDTDAFILRPFRDRLSQLLGATAGVGIYGDYPIDSAGRAILRPDLIENIQRPFANRHRLGTFKQLAKAQILNIGWRRHQLAAIRLALHNGYEPGRHCQGGCYAITREFARTMIERGMLANKHLWGYTQLGYSEDVLASMYCVAAGFKVVFDESRFISSNHVGLKESAESLVQKGFSFVHSVKGANETAESQLRKVFGIGPSAMLGTPTQQESVCST